MGRLRGKKLRQYQWHQVVYELMVLKYPLAEYRSWSYVRPDGWQEFRCVHWAAGA